MTHHTKTTWHDLRLIGFAGLAALLLATRLPIAQRHPTLFLLLWVACFYGALAVWLRRNEVALTYEPPVLGREMLFIEPERPADEAEPEPVQGLAGPVPHYQTETM